MASQAPSEQLAEALSELPLELGAPQSTKLLELVTLVEAWASRINLTGHRGVEGILAGLVVEALALERVLPACETLLDLGSGAGFPGLPIAIARGAGCHVSLLDARERRHHFQRAAIRTLALSNVTPIHGRAEQLEPVQHQIVLAQALAQPEDALRLMERWAVPGGTLALALSQAPELGLAAPLFVRTEVRRYRVPLSGRERVLWLGELPS